MGKSPFSASERGKSFFSIRVGEVRFLSRLEWVREKYFLCGIREGKSPFSVSGRGKSTLHVILGRERVHSRLVGERRVLSLWYWRGEEFFLCDDGEGSVLSRLEW